jgi:plastocyanin
MVAGKDALIVLESNSGQVLNVTVDGKISRLVDLSEGHPVPTGLALGGDGSIYVGFLTPTPYKDGSSKVVKITPDGKVADAWTGLTMITGLAVGKADTLYALEMATGNTEQPPFVKPGTGRVVRQTGPASAEEVVTGLDYPIAMAMGAGGQLHVGFPAFGADDAAGAIIAIDLTAKQPIAFDPAILDTSKCPGGIPTTPAATTAPATTPAATAEPAMTAQPSGKGATGSEVVQIQNFAFNPKTVEIPVGTTVTWTNLDTVAHTATGTTDASFNSGNLNQNQSFSYTFAKAGSYPYVCLYHSQMTGTIEVQ